MSLRSDRITGALVKHPFVISAVLVLAVLAATGMQINNNILVCSIMVPGYILVAGYGLYLKKARKLSDEALTAIIFALGFILRLGYVLYTSIEIRQNDIGVFQEGNYNIFHSGYILFMRDRFSIPDFDVRIGGQFYHPPFHYFVSAVFLKIYELFLPAGTHNYEALQALSLLWSQYSLIMIFKVLKLLGIREEDHVTSAYIISAFKELARVKPVKLAARIDGKVISGEFLYGQITNSRSVGGFRAIGVKDMSFSDGKFECLFIKKPKNPLELAKILTAIATNKMNPKLMYKCNAKEVVIVGKEPIPWTKDGEYGGTFKKIKTTNGHKAISIVLNDKSAYNKGI